MNDEHMINEGTPKKGGLNSKPTTPPPAPPKAQRPARRRPARRRPTEKD